MSLLSSPKIDTNTKFEVSDLVIVFFWILMALVVAYRRSLWGDEWNHVQDLKNGLFWATQEILNKPSPFAPGEVVLNWLPKMLLSPLGGTMEVWARVQGIAWAAGTLAIALSMARREKLLKFLPLLVAFSAALISSATEMRPYASLFFSGAVVAKILRDQGIKSKGFNIAVWFTIFFGHLYGVCFILASLFLCTGFKQWKKFLAGVIYLAVVFSSVRISIGQTANALPPWADIFRQTLGTLGNPHKASWFFCPIALLGVMRLWKTHRTKTIQMLGLLFITVVGPIVATYIGKYFFVPRQVVAGSFLFLYFVAVGFQELRTLLPAPIVLFFAILGSVVPWVLSTILGVPPFSNQPFHRFREVSQEVVAGSYKSPLFIDFCNSGPFTDYLGQAKGSAPVSREQYELEGFRLIKSCWGDGFCLHTPIDIKYCAVGSDELMPGSKAARLFESGRFDIILHGSLSPFHLSPKVKEIPLKRVW